MSDELDAVKVLLKQIASNTCYEAETDEGQAVSNLSDINAAREALEILNTASRVNEVERENKILKARLEGFEATAHQFCLDCRDKVKHESCLRCQVQALSNVQAVKGDDALKTALEKIRYGTNKWLIENPTSSLYFLIQEINMEAHTALTNKAGQE